MGTMMQSLSYWLSEHPSIIGFRWNHSQSWGSTWSFLFTSIAAYITLSIFIRLVLALFRCRRPVPLGPIPAVHSLAMALISLIIFVGILFSSAAEIRETRWFWRRTKTPFQWFLCFPLGTRPTGRIPPLVPYILHHSPSPETDVLSIIQSINTIVYVIFVVGIFSIISSGGDFVDDSSLLGGLWVPILDRNWITQCLFSVCGELPGGCNGIGAWVFNSVLNAAILLLFMNFYVKMHLRKRKKVVPVVVQDDSSSSNSSSKLEMMKKEIEMKEAMIKEKDL
ncbi:GNS1/SUR4 membrane protein [Macleaya cordata]|uniref:GNS1/SUR4 membrane protein n=1 Tax=Macleaya cordata TaxID=56857 RepID=A0A200R7J5_MACCD|nr:GNS1/SUR4 membrane protein [Macleaya cordata]